MSKAGLVVIAFKKILSLPERKDKNLNEKANKFTRGLESFVNRTFKRSLDAFKEEL